MDHRLNDSSHVEPPLGWRRPDQPAVHRPGLSGPGDKLRLSANESPYGPIPPVLERMQIACSRVNRYPDITGSALRTSLAERLGVTAEQIVLGSGSSELIHALVAAFGDDGAEIMLPYPSFPMYTVSASLTDARVVRVPIAADGAVDLQAMADAVTDATRLIFICNPNNPTGGFHSADALAEFLAKIPPRVCVALDEAYWELTDAYVNGAPDSMGLVRQYPNVVVLRTFSKFYGLAGVRMGYAVTCCTTVADRLGAARMSAMPNVVALEAASACLDHFDAYMERAREAARERNRVTTAAKNLGYELYPTQTNFYCFAFAPGPEPFLEAGLLVRGGDSIQFPGHVRVSFGTPEDNDRVLAVLRAHAPVHAQAQPAL